MNASIHSNFTPPHAAPAGSVQEAPRKTTLVRNLWLLLFAQILLAIGVFAYQRNAQPELDAKALLDFNIDSVDRLVINDADKAVTLVKSGSGWQLPDFHQLPVDAQKINNVLDKLKGTKLTWPATTTESSHERFEVTDKKFQRRLDFFAGDKKAGEIYLGTSPGFKKVHVRRAGENEVYAVVLSAFEFETLNKAWLDTSLLAAKQLTEMRGSDYHVRKDGEDWRFTDDTAVSVDATKVAALVNGLADFSVQDVAADKPTGEATNLWVKTAAGEWQYEFIKAGTDHFVKRNDRELYFTITAQEFQQVAHVKKSDLAAATPTQNDTSPPAN